MEVADGAKIHLTSAAAFVEGGSQDALDDACSVCLEAFCESDPSTVTSCKHEFHLQCVLEWCQRSSNCPMCWQAISLKDPSSQELLETVERERIQRAKPLPLGVDAAELEDQMMQHLAAAAAVGRTRRLTLARREGRRSNSSVQTNPQLIVPSANPNESSTAPVSDSVNEPASSVNNHSQPLTRSVYVNQNIQSVHPSRIRASEPSSTTNSDSGGSSELQSISEKWKSRFSSMSMKYKESISKSTREWKEKLFSRSSTMPQLMEHMETRENQAEAQRNNSQVTSDGSNGGRLRFLQLTAT